MGLIGIPGTIDKAEDENAMPFLISKGTTKSCLIGHKYMSITRIPTMYGHEKCKQRDSNKNNA